MSIALYAALDSDARGGRRGRFQLRACVPRVLSELGRATAVGALPALHECRSERHACSKQPTVRCGAGCSGYCGRWSSGIDDGRGQARRKGARRAGSHARPAALFRTAPSCAYDVLPCGSGRHTTVLLTAAWRKWWSLLTNRMYSALTWSREACRAAAVATPTATQTATRLQRTARTSAVRRACARIPHKSPKTRPRSPATTMWRMTLSGATAAGT